MALVAQYGSISAAARGYGIRRQKLYRALSRRHEISTHGAMHSLVRPPTDGDSKP